MNCIKKLESQVAIVTGAGQGLGEELAKRLDKEGCKIVVADINYDNAKKVTSKLEEAIAVKVDITKENEVENMVNSAINKWGKLDILVSNAGILIAKALIDFSLNEWRKMIDVNLK